MCSAVIVTVLNMCGESVHNALQNVFSLERANLCGESVCTMLYRMCSL